MVTISKDRTRSSYIVENKIQNKFDEIARFYEKK